MVTRQSLLGMFQQNPDQFQTLLGQYYDPRQAKMQWLGGTLQGLGAGLASGEQGAWAQGAIAGGGQGVDDYKRQALIGYKTGQDQENQAYARSQDEQNNAWRQQQWDYKVGQDKLDNQHWNQSFGLQQQRLADAQNGGGSPEFGLQPVGIADKDGKFIGWGQMSKAGGLYFNGQPIDSASGLQPLSPFATNNLKAAGTASGTQQGGAAAALPAAILDAQATTDKIDALRANPNLGDAVGYGSALGDMLTSNEVLDIRRQVNELKGSAFMSAYSALKGGGQITEVEGAQAKQSLADMDTAMKASDPEMFKKALDTFRSAVSRGVQKLQAQAGQFSPEGQPMGAAPAAPAQGGAEEWSIDANGKPVRVR